MAKEKKAAAPAKPSFSEKQRKRATILYWLGATFPLYFIAFLLLFQSEDDLPPVAMLDNPPELLASVIYADDGTTELGRYWKINRTSVEYKQISPNVTDALIATEDERFHEHAGVDARAIGRAIVNAGSAGGASTITQQLAKQLFTLQIREREEMARASGIEINEPAKGRIGRMWGRLNEKARENIIAIRLEKRFTKEEIITMYLNQFDFLYNAVGIANASKVYFNKKPSQLSKEEAAMLIGMCKNPTLYNPYTFKVKDYRTKLANKKGVGPNAITAQEIAEARANDSLRAVGRRNQVLKQWLINSEDPDNDAIRHKLTQAEYESLSKKPIITDYQVVDHKRGVAPYFRESLRGEVTKLLNERKPDGSLKFKRPDGLPWDIYRDGLRIYTTINADMQEYGEYALEKHLKDLQSQFDRNNRGLKNWPYSNSISEAQVKSSLNTSMRRSDRYISMKAAGYTEEEIINVFKTRTEMRIFSWKGERDTVMTPMDSIRYYKSFLQAGLMSVEPSTGFIKAWVGGANIDHFAYDHVRLGRRQVGSTIKPFIYGAGITMGVVTPGMVIPNIRYCVDLEDPQFPDKKWCPGNSDGSGNGGTVSIKRGLAMSMNNVAVYIMSRMGPKAGPETVAKLMRSLDIELSQNDVVPAMCLGSMDLSLYEMVSAQASFVNKGIFNKPTAILRIEDRSGNVIYSAKSVSREVMNENVAYAVLKMMKGVIEGGTGSRLRYAAGYGGILYPTAGKTGTTQNNSDGWFIGLTPDLATGVWVGADERGIRFRSTAEGQGARVAMPIYGYYMNKIYKDPKIALSTTDFDRPNNFDDSMFDLTGTEYTPTQEETEGAVEEIIPGI